MVDLNPKAGAVEEAAAPSEEGGAEDPKPNAGEGEGEAAVVSKPNAGEGEAAAEDGAVDPKPKAGVGEEALVGADEGAVCI